MNALSQEIYAWATINVPVLTNLTPISQSLLLAVAALLVGQLIAAALRLLVRLTTPKNKTDDYVFARIQQPLAWLVFSALLYVALIPLTIASTAVALLTNILISINIFLAAWVVTRLANAILTSWRIAVTKRSKTLQDDAVLPLFSRFVSAIIWIGAFVSVLAAWGLAIGPLLAGIGLAGIAIGFAVKDSLANIFGGVSLALDRAYKVGDKVRLQDGTVGVVHDISLRSTRVRTYDGDMVMVPNGKIANDNIYTFTQPNIRSRVSVDFSIAYGTKVEKAREVILKAINKIEGIEAEPAPAVHFQEMGDSGLAMRLNFWVPDYTQAIFKKREATQAIYDALNKAKINIPFPQLTLHMKKE